MLSELVDCLALGYITKHWTNEESVIIIGVSASGSQKCSSSTVSRFYVLQDAKDLKLFLS
jgi:hypothetical protein